VAGGWRAPGETREVCGDPRSWFVTVKHHLLLRHRCILPSQGQRSLPSLCRWSLAPQAGGAGPGPRRVGGNGSSLCASAPCPVTAPKPVLGYGGCAVSSDRTSLAAALQRHVSLAELMLQAVSRVPESLSEPCTPTSFGLFQTQEYPGWVGQVGSHWVGLPGLDARGVLPSCQAGISPLHVPPLCSAALPGASLV